MRKNEYSEDYPWSYVYRGNGYGYFSTEVEALNDFHRRRLLPKNNCYQFGGLHKGKLDGTNSTFIRIIGVDD